MQHHPQVTKALGERELAGFLPSSFHRNLVMKPAEDSSPSTPWHRGGQNVMNEFDIIGQNITFED